MTDLILGAFQDTDTGRVYDYALRTEPDGPSPVDFPHKVLLPNGHIPAKIMGDVAILYAGDGFSGSYIKQRMFINVLEGVDQ